MKEHELENRVTKIRGWLEFVSRVYDELLSRREETASVGGFDGESRVRPCEHRRIWQRGRLCLACDNSGWRPLFSRELLAQRIRLTTLEEHWPGWVREELPGVDPYSRDLPKGSVSLRGSERKTMALEEIDYALDAIRRAERMRMGMEAAEDSWLRAERVAWVKLGPFGRKLLRYVRVLARMPVPRERWPELLAVAIPGRIQPPPGE